MRNLHIVVLLLMMFAAPVAADSYYFCDFENDAENAKWQLNTPKNENYSWTNLWYIGKAAPKDGEKGLFISADGGNTAGYKAVSNIMISWREFDNLEPGDYDMALDWRNVGDSLRAVLYVAWVPEKDFSKMICGQNDDVSTRKWLTDNYVVFDAATSNTSLLAGSSVWSHSVGKIKVEQGIKYRLTVVYLTSGNAALRNPGACVDNIQIARNNCGTPTDLNVSVSGRQATFTWKSNAEKFNIRYSKQGSSDVQTVNGLTSPQLIVNLDHGVYNFYIQVICNGEESVWYSFPVVIIFDSKCFNYLDLHDDQCFFLDETAGRWQDNDIAFALSKGKKIDHGYLSVESRHTVHYMEGEVDARTYNSFDTHGNPVPALRTIPDGEIASVRVGSWDEAHAARIIYDFTVDTTEAAVLMLKYALVLQYADHSAAERPRFVLKVVDADSGQELSTCTSVDFAAEVGGEGWFRSPARSDKEADARDVCWRDWTTVGLNLTEFNGTHVRILLTSYGCTYSAHYGYAYFTLNCTSGRIEGINCGDTPTNEFIAPEGFDYKWHLASDTTTLSTDRIFPVDYDDDRLYKVDVLYKTNRECGFSLSACAIPRYPVPEATYEVYQKDCKNYIRFNNNSHVRTKNLRTGEVIEDSEFDVESVLWNFGDIAPQSAEWSPEIEAPTAGSQIRVSLTAGVGLCDSTAYLDITVPEVSPDTIEEVHNMCLGQSYTHKGATYTSDTTIVFSGKSVFGCDSVHTLTLTFAEAIQTDIYDTIPEGETREFYGKDYTTTGDYDQVFQSVAGCDSIITLHLYVEPHLKVVITSMEEPCADAHSFEVSFRAEAGEIDSCYVLFADEQHRQGWQDIAAKVADTLITIAVPDDVLPGWYPFTMHFTSLKAGTCDIVAEVAVRYPASIIQQRWDDVLGILNQEHNGGFVFSTFQWYKNGEPIEGATSPYFYTEDKLDVTAAYTVLLVREGDERTLMSCEFYPAVVQSAPQGATMRKYLQGGRLYIQVGDKTYNVFGHIVL